MAGIQRRQGPNYVGLFGLLQPFADGLKLIFKETNIPMGVYYYIFLFCSISSLSLSLLNWTVIPFNSGWVFADVNFGLLFILMISSLNVYTILFSGWASNTKYGALGSIRSGAQMVSYELPLTMSLLVVIMLSGTCNLTNIINAQCQTAWYIFLLFPAALIFLISAFAETNRTPFDLPEAESELVAGYNIEYASLSFALFFLSEYNQILIMSFLFTTVFLGGWSVCFVNFGFFVENIIENIFGWGDFLAAYLQFKIKINNFIIFNFLLKYPSLCWNLLLLFQTLVVVVKSLLVANFFILVRACLPRYKYTQLIELCWRVFLPFIFVYFYIVMIISYLW